LHKNRSKVIFELKETQKFSGSILNQNSNEDGLDSLITAEDSRTKFQSMIRGSWDLDIGKRPVIVIDNGSYECRAGWSNDTGDKPYLRFKNQISKPKTLISKEIDAMHLIGDEFSLFDASKLHKKTMFDREVVTNSGLLEHVFDYCFSHLGINEQIKNPILLTEAMSNPNQCRVQTNELMFECYRAPAVSYAVDSLCGFYY
jgi:actin-related protein 5